MARHALGIDLFLHQQGLNTTTPAGKAMFQMMGVFAEFERADTRLSVVEAPSGPRPNVPMLDELAKRGAGFRSLKDSWADTTTPHGKLMVTVLGGLAEFERELIRARTGEGRKRAQERGVRFGRPRKLTPHQRAEALQRIAQGETQADIARLLNVSAPTISRLAAASPFEHGVAAGLG